MQKAVKNLLTQLPKALAGRTGGRNNKRRNNRRRTRAQRSRRRRTVNNPSWGRSLPAAYAAHVTPRFNVSARSATSCRVSGCDLVYPLPATVQSGNDTIFAVIPCNPAYWTGTRIAQFAPAYMNYRPISMTFSYIPQVAVTQPGTVYMGTFWNGSAPAPDLQQSLFTSNGGMLTQCYVPADTRIQLGANLPQNLFQLNGALRPESNPFIFVAGIRGSDVVPGYFYVTYTYEFKNPIGQTWNYARSTFTTVSNLSEFQEQNKSLVLLEADAGYGPGTVMDVEDEDSIFYNGTAVTLDSGTAIQLFGNSQSANFLASRQAEAAK